MHNCMTWLARVSVCVAVSAPGLVAAPALANGKFTERLFTAQDGAVYKVRQPADSQVSDEEILRAVAQTDAETKAAAAAALAKDAAEAAPAETAATPAKPATAAAAAETKPAAPAATTRNRERKAATISSKSGARNAVAADPVDTRDLTCLTEALYFEARGEGTAGQKAVAEVILNRVDHPRFPKSVCGVVNQSGQFSYHGRVAKRFNEKAAYLRAKSVAMAALSGAPRDLTGGATYFHTPAVRPSWSRKFTRTARIGSHIFYRPGGAQRLASN